MIQKSVPRMVLVVVVVSLSVVSSCSKKLQKLNPGMTQKRVEALWGKPTETISLPESTRDDDQVRLSSWIYERKKLTQAIDPEVQKVTVVFKDGKAWTVDLLPIWHEEKTREQGLAEFKAREAYLKAGGDPKALAAKDAKEQEAEWKWCKSRIPRIWAGDMKQWGSINDPLGLGENAWVVEPSELPQRHTPLLCFGGTAGRLSASWPP